MSELHDRIRDFWDRDAETYDRSPTHAASLPVEAAAWRAALRRHLPPPGATILDAGAGTGSISLLLAELGYRVTGLDLSPEMLARARAKAEGLGLELELVVGKAEEPPAGPFDGVVERNMLWTNPEPLRTLEAWLAVTVSGGTLLLLEGIPGGSGMTNRAREMAAEAVRRALRVPDDHHAEYDPDLMAALPLAGASSPAPLIGVVADAGWGRIRIERLRDVEWARRMAAHPVLGPLQAVPLYALIAEA